MIEKHSPGPWYEHVTAADSLELRDADGNLIAVWHYGSEPKTADFLLLKHAPEMLPFLRCLMRLNDDEGWAPCDEVALRQLLRRIDGKDG